MFFFKRKIAVHVKLDGGRRKMAEGVAAQASHSATQMHSASSKQAAGRAPKSLAEIKVSAQKKQFKVSAEGRRKAALVVSSASLLCIRMLANL